MKYSRTLFMMTAGLLGSIAACAPTPTVHAQAYCALRDPVQQVYELFPEATSYHSLVRSVDKHTRSLISQKLPFTLHFNELGRHTLYVALRGDVPIGVVHVRSEAGRWGLVEIAWALSLDLDVVGFHFQRCRDNAHKQIESLAIASTLTGLDFEGLRDMLNESGDGLSAAAQPIMAQHTDAARQLMVTTLRSALKTMVVTNLVWASDLRQVQLIQMGLTAFPGAATVEIIHSPYEQEGLPTALAAHVGSTTGIDRSGVTALLIRDKTGTVLGMKCQTPWSAGDVRANVWWAIDAAGRTLTEITPDAKNVDTFADLHGHRAADFDRCSTAVQLAGKEVITMANACLDAADDEIQGERR